MRLQNKNLLYFFIPILLVITYPLIDTIVYNLLLYVASFFPNFESYLNNSYSMMDSLLTLILLIAFFPLYRLATKDNDKKKLKPINSRFILACIPLSLSLGGISYIILELIEKYFVPLGILEKDFSDFSNMWGQIDNESYFWVFLSIVFIGPIFEEVLFRGIIYNFLEKYKPGIFPVVLSGLLFGFWHGQVVQSIYTAIMGMVLGYIYMKTKNLFYPILLHILNNLYSTLPQSIESDYIYNIIDVTSVLMVIPFIFVFVIELKEYRKLISSKKHKVRNLY